ncbi:MAG: protein kinase [Myxococcales bacterium]|nr:protein kinase [Myxococcales bacterium]
MTRDVDPMHDPALDRTVSAEEAGAAPPDAGPRLRPGGKVGRYQIVEFLAGGGMGWVYRARDAELERDVAIKVVQPTAMGAQGRERLLAEARAMARLQHRAVVPVFDVGEHAGGVYVAMALLTGGTLHDWMHAAARPWREVLARFIEAGRGLVAAHAAGLVHRDFKPKNVLIGDAGEVMVADFGIASASATGSGDGGAHETSTVAGTPAYMAPEQAEGKAVDARADQYSFCVSLWEGLHGQRPQEADTRTQGPALERAPDAPKARRAVPAWLTAALVRGFASQPERRWPTMQALLDVLERGLGRRRRIALGAAGVGCVAAVAAALVAMRPAPRDPCPTPDGLTWNPVTRATIALAFRATGSQAADDTLARVVPPLRGYVRGWQARMIDSCRATHVSHTQSAELLDRRAVCLDGRRAHAAGLIATFASADRAVVADAIGAVASMPGLEACDRGDVLIARPMPSPEQRSAVAAVQRQLAHGRDLGLRGRHREALEVFEAARAAARASGWAPLHAEALEAVARTRILMFLPSDDVVDELAVEAAKAKDDARALFALVELVTKEQLHGNLDRAAALEPVLNAAILRTDGEDTLKVRAELVMAWRATAAHDDRLATERIAAAEAHAVTPALRGEVLGQRARAQRDAAAALPLFEQAQVELRRAYGESEPHVGRSYVDIANVKFRMGDVDGAEVAWRAAGAIYQGSFGDTDSPSMSDYLQLGGMIAEVRGRIDEAVSLLTRAAKVYRDMGMPESHAQAERNLANVLSNGTDDQSQAEVHYRRALEVMERARGKSSVEYADIEATFGMFLAMEDCAAGMPYLEHARPLLEAVRHPTLASLFAQLGDCAEARDPDMAARHYQAARVICTDRGCPAGMLEQLGLAQGKLLARDPATRARALAMLEDAQAGFARLGDDEAVAEVKTELARWKR